MPDEMGEEVGGWLAGRPRRTIAADVAEPAHPDAISEVEARRVSRAGLRIVKLPLFGEIHADDELRDRVDGAFLVPMTVLSLVFLGLLGVEFLWPLEGAAAAAIDASFALIWMAFAAELATKTVIAESRLGYLRKNWIDLVVLLLPFLRPLRVAAQMANVARGLRLRGAGTKLARNSLPYIVSLPVANKVARRLGLGGERVSKPPEEMTRDELIDEVKQLRARLPPEDAAG